ncbi:helix-turn-helix domain-containing protein [Sphingomonas solaris]|uniref:ImmA/IrrE family metallo-endopeptidase n=1 Tax=Alterirhizorhabdus solaris TaxID=2529389 RepID=A0A558RBW6_9SPHN|nr:helix-turn-helix transcriptional regulator [Sphingomonas solaris]TVV76876.1 ImmA/IrrE family metallo-endopeptidase [Sphingomonas solaris]
MAEQKIFAGHRIRRLRRAAGLTQAAMAVRIDISPSYLNLIERNQRPLTAALMLRLADVFDFDPRTLAADEPGGGGEALRRRLADPMFADLGIDRSEVEEWLAAAPGGAEAFARVFDRLREGGEGGGGIGPAAGGEDDAIAPVRREIERWRNHFADLDAAAETLADDLRLDDADLYGAIAERLRVKHRIAIRILPIDVMPDRLRRLDLHARQLQLSEMLDPASRNFQAAFQLGQLEARAEVEALVAGAAFGQRTAERLFRRHLLGYFAAALLMPYDRFLRACERTGYDLDLLRRRFNTGFEMIAHRLTTLSRVGARGLPFFMLRIDRAGQVSKRFAGASAAPMVEAQARCPLWRLHHAFDRPGEVARQLVELEDGTRWFTLARTVRPQVRSPDGVRAEFAIGLGVVADHATPLADARGIDLKNGAATPIGLGCRRCTRIDCPQRAAPPAGRPLTLNDRERGLTPFTFVGE